MVISIPCHSHIGVYCVKNTSPSFKAIFIERKVGIMLSGSDLRDYRSISGLSLRDVARYCNITAQMIGAVERGEYNLTESTYQEIVKGINTAKQRITEGKFGADKAKGIKEKKARVQVKQKPEEVYG